jgi:hypothetical protein
MNSDTALTYSFEPGTPVVVVSLVDESGEHRVFNPLREPHEGDGDLARELSITLLKHALRNLEG